MFPFDLPSFQRHPLRTPGPEAWPDHAAFARDLVAGLRPRLLVALGAGRSYFALCRAVLENAAGTVCHAVEAGAGDEDFHKAVREHNAEHFATFSHLIRAESGEAAARFADGSIELLHLADLPDDNAAARRAREIWLPKVRPGGVILLPGIAAGSGAPGAGRYFAFTHGDGLGVYQPPIPENADPADLPPGSAAPLLRTLFSGGEPAAALARHYAGTAETLREAAGLQRQLEKTTQQLRESDEELAETLRDRTEAWRELAATNDALAHARQQSGRIGDERLALRRQMEADRAELVARQRETEQLAAELAKARAELAVDRGRVRSMRESVSWKVTLPLRALGRALPALPSFAGGGASKNGRETASGGEPEFEPAGEPGKRVATFQHWLDTPKGWNLSSRRVRVSGWCLPPVNLRLVGVRVVVDGRAVVGRFGFPRADVAKGLDLLGDRGNCGFDVDVRLPGGPSKLTLEVQDSAGGWHFLDEFEAQAPVLDWSRLLKPKIDAASSLGIDTPTDWNLLTRSLRIAGWCLPPAGQRITAIRAVCRGRASVGQHGYRRPDLAERLNLPPGGEKCGFEIFVDLPPGRSLLKIEVCDEQKRWHVVGRFPLRAPFLARADQKIEADSIMDYATWVKFHDTLRPALRKWMQGRIAGLERQPLISVVMPVYNTPEHFLIQAIESVRAQVYPHWELCIADDASPQPHVRPLLERYAAKDPRIRVVFRPANGHISAASNSALEIAKGEYIALLDHDDELNPAALFAVVDEINDHPAAELLYSDEDKIDPAGHRFGPYFKPDWNPDLLAGQNYLCHLVVYRAELLRRIGGFRVGLEGSQDWDLVLRATEILAPETIRHIPRVLYHWRAIPGSTALMADAKGYVNRSAERALSEHFERAGQRVEIVDTPEGYWRVKHALPEPPPLVSILIPTRNQVTLLRRCVDSILADKTFDNFELVIVDNQSDDPATLTYFATLTAQDARCRILPYPKPFNYSALNNYAVEHARGDLVLLLNNDVEVIGKGWLKELASQAIRPGIGCVGAMLYYPDNTIQHAGVVLGTGGVAGHAFKSFRRGNNGHGSRLSLVQNYSAVTAACLMVKRSIFQEVGGLDAERLTVAFNDVDFCLKVLKAGYRNLWTPFAELYHHESASRGLETTPEKVERFGAEIETMRERWEALLQNDPAYNPNLTLLREDFSFASPPRLSKTWGR